MKKNRTRNVIAVGIVLMFVCGAFAPVVGSISKNGEQVTATGEKSNGLDVSPEESLLSRFLLSMDSGGLSSSNHNAPPSPLNVDDPWWNTGWSYRKEITIDHTQVAATLANFPVLISFASDADLANKAQDDGDDLIFTDGNGVKLNHEIELYTSGTGRLIAWVNVSSVSSSVDTVLYIYYGNAGCSNQQNPEGVWNSQYVMVQHLKEASGTHYDSTSYSNDGTPSGVTQNVAGMIDGADGFDGSNDNISCGSGTSLNTDTAFTLEAWVKPLDLTHYQGLIVKGTGVGAPYTYCFALTDAGKPGVYVNNGWRVANSVLSSGTWQYAVVSYDDTNVYFYLNGQPDGSAAESGSGINTDPLRIGHWATYWFKGSMDEVRVSKVKRNASWISTCYQNQQNPSGFYSVGSEERPVAPVLSVAYPAEGAIGVGLNPVISIRADDIQADQMTIIFKTNASGSWQDLGTYTGYNGTYSQPTSIMSSYNTKYWWRVNASDGAHSTEMTYSFTTISSWWNPGWMYRKLITINHLKVATNLVNFPVLIDVTDSGLYAHAQGDGDDIVFTTYSGVKLDHDIELYTTATGHLVAWVKVPSLSSTADTPLYIYYGNSGCSAQENPGGVWAGGYRLVQHLEETSGIDYDSTSYANDGTCSGGMNQNAVGKVDGADEFDGADDAVNVGSAASLDDISTITISAWVKLDSFGEGNYGWIYDKGFTNGKAFYLNGAVSANGLAFTHGFTGGSPNPYGWWRADNCLSVGPWYYVAVTFNNSNAGNDPVFYVNGNVVSGVEGNVPSGSALSDASFNGIIGNDASTAYTFDGVIDEVRISSSIRSSAWISTEFNNQQNPSTFVTLRSEEVFIPDAPVLSNEYPLNGTIDLLLNPTLSIHAGDYQANQMTITFKSNASGSWQDLGTYVGYNGTYSQPTTTMNQYNKSYWWGIHATDGSHSTDWIYHFKTKIGPGPWWNSLWLYRREIVVNHTKVAADLTNFPVLINITNSDLSSHAQSDGDDFIFANYNGVKLDHEIEYYNSVTGHLIAWVKLPSLSCTKNITLYMYYGNFVCSAQENPSGVWGSDYHLIHHLSETSGTSHDSTIYNNDGIPQGGLNQNTIGKIDGSDLFDGVDDYIRLGDPDSLEFSTALTLEAWINHTSLSNWQNIISKWDDTGGRSWSLTSFGSGNIYFFVGGADAENQYDSLATISSISPGSWHYLAATFDSGQMKIYLDGVLNNQKISSDPGHTVTTLYNTGTIDALIGYALQWGGSMTTFFNGGIDEVRVSNTVRTAEWISTCYNNENAPSSFYMIGSEAIGAYPDEPQLSNAYPSNGAVSVPLNPALSIYAFDFQGESITLTFRSNASGAWQDLGTYVGGNNTYSQPTTTMNNYIKKYWWSANATNAGHGTWKNQTFYFTTRPENLPPVLSNPIPATGMTGIPLFTTLSITANHPDGKPMNIIFETNASGSWATIGSYVNVPNGTYSPSYRFLKTGTVYWWSVHASDGQGHWTNETYSFTTFNIDALPDGIDLGTYTCAGLPYAIYSAEDKNVFYVIWYSRFQDPQEDFSLYYAEFNRSVGWVTTNASLCDWSGETVDNVVHWLGYFNDSYHVFYAEHPSPQGYPLVTFNASTWSDFQSYAASDTEYQLDPNLRIVSWGSVYSFSNDYAWSLTTKDYDNASGDTITIWTWNRSNGWDQGRSLWQTSTGQHNHYPHDVCGPTLLPVNKTTWYLYFVADAVSPYLRYLKSTDGGRTWGTIQETQITCDGLTSRPALMRYGNTFYMILKDAASADPVCYNSTDGEHWYNRTVMYSPYDLGCAYGLMIDQSHLLWLAADNYKFDPRYEGSGWMRGGVYKISEMLAHPKKPSDPSPLNGTMFAAPTNTIYLNITVHGTQTYDVAFYWENGSFIGVDKLLREGDIATISTIKPSRPGVHKWYAISRGATWGYIGEPASTIDENRSATFWFTNRDQPMISQASPANVTGDVGLNPVLSIRAVDWQGDQMTITFKTNASGSWQDLGTYVDYNGTYSQPTTTMNSYNTRYWWRVCAKDAGSGNWTNATYCFTTRSPPQPWWNPSWPYRKMITIDHTKVAASLANFPVLISLSSDADLAGNAQEDGDDIVFTTYDGSVKLDHEVELYTTATGHLVAWVKMPSLSSTADTPLYIYYGNSGCNAQENPSGVWAGGYRLVQHLEETSGVDYDSTSYANDGTCSGGMNQNAVGKVDGADEFDGVDDAVNVGSAASLDDISTITISAWVKLDSFGGGGGAGAHYGWIYDKGFTNGKAFYLSESTNGLAFVHGFTGGSPDPYGWWHADNCMSVGPWYYVVVTYDNSNAGNDPVFYVNGNVVSAIEGNVPSGSSLSDASYNGIIGNDASTSYPFDGLIDEVRISNPVKSSAWISTEYSNQQNPSSFIRLGSEEPILNNAPVAQNDTYSTNEETVLTVVAPGVLGNDTDMDGDPLTAVKVSDPTHGVVTLNSNGSFTYTPAGTYHGADSFTYKANDGIAYSNIATVTIQVIASPPWWNHDWGYRKLLTINHTKIGANEVNFPILINLTDSDLHTHAQPDGDDLVFTDYAGTKLSHEIELYNQSSGRLVAWVKVPSLSSTQDTQLFMYYGNPSCSAQGNPPGVWDSSYVMVQHLGENVNAHVWQKYAGNPVLPGGTDGFGSVLKDPDTGIYHFYYSWGTINHATSTDGITWTKDTVHNPVLTPTVAWEGDNVGVPMVWKEGSTWRMLYRAGSTTKIGLANSTDGITWVKSGRNPVISGTPGMWDETSLDPWGIIKIGSTYYEFYNTVGASPVNGQRCVGLATSTDLQTWTKDSHNPIYTNGEFCAFPFKYGEYYYMLVPRYHDGNTFIKIHLFRDHNPTFYPSEREYLGVAIDSGVGSWDPRLDTPCVLTDTVFRDSYSASNNQLWAYYAGGSWSTGMCIEPSISLALSKVAPAVYYDSTSHNNDGERHGGVKDVVGRIDGAVNFDGSSGFIDCGNNTSLNITSALTIDAWVKLDTALSAQPNLLSGIVSKKQGTTGYAVLFSRTVRTLNVSLGSVNVSADVSGYDWTRWHHIAGVYNGSASTVSIYIDGALVTSQSYSGPVGTNTAHLVLGDLVQSPGMRLDGSLDEVRISNIARSASWVNISYSNQKNPGAFYLLHTEEVTKAPIISDEQPLQGASHLGLNPTLQAHILDLQVDSVQWWIRSNASGSWSTLSTGTLPVGNGTVMTIPSTMNKYNTTYWWSVNASDGVHWTNTSYRFTTQIGAPVISHVQPLDGSTEVNLNPTLQATIMDYQGDSVNWWIKSNATGSWAVINSGTLVDGNGTISGVPVTMNRHATKYWWSVNASDGQLWTNGTYRFITKPGLTKWLYRKRIVINHSMVSENLSGFAVLVQLTNDQDLKNHAQSDFDDVLFTNESVTWANGTQADRLSHQIEAFNSTTGNLTVWVRCNLSSTTDTILYMYYGNPNCGRMENRSGVWDTNYRMVQHLNETSVTHYDSTSYHNNGTCSGTMTHNATGKIDGADWFDGLTGTVNCGHSLSLNITGKMTISFWFNTSKNDGSVRRILQKGSRGYSVYLWNANIAFGHDAGFKYTNSIYNDNKWHYVVCRYDGSGTFAGLQIFIDGAEVTSVTNTGTFTGFTFYPTGDLSFGGVSAFYRGSVDEVRISNISRSVGWIATSNSNQRNPSLFCTAGSEQNQILVHQLDERPSNGAIGVGLNPVLSIQMYNAQEKQMTFSFRTNSSGSWQDLGTYAGGNGAYSQPTAVMNQYHSTYWWSVNATDGTHWTNTTYHFATQSIPLIPGHWWNSGWSYRKLITIDHTKVSGGSALIDFPVLISLTDAELHLYAQSTGNDILFTDYSGNKLNHQIELYTSSTGRLLAWVKIPILSTTQDTLLFMYYGNTSCGAQGNAHGVWESNYRMVQHLNETSVTHYDSTSYHNNGTCSGTMTHNTTGKIDGADWFDGLSGTVNCGSQSSLDITGKMTISFWFNTTQTGSGVKRILQKAGVGYSVYLYAGNGGNIAFGRDAGFKYTNAHYNDNKWHYVVCRYNNSGTFAGLQIFIDGAEVTLVTNTGTFAGFTSSPTTNLYFGGVSAFYRGSLDEVQISSINRSTGWITTSYTNQNNPGVFYSVGPQQRVTVPFQYDEQPLQSTVNISLNPTLSIQAIDWQEHQITITIKSNTSGSWQTLGSYTGKNGIYSQPTTNMNSYNTRYWWSVNVTNGVNWTERLYKFTTQPGNRYTLSLQQYWNLISLPCNELTTKNNIRIKYDSIEYDWSTAVSTGIILDSFYSWDTTGYILDTSLTPGKGYWLWAYHACELIVRSTAQESTSLTTLSDGWNTVGLPLNISVLKNTLLVRYDNVDYTWAQATTNDNPTGEPIILGFIYGWNRIDQMYLLSGTFNPGNGYWMYAYKDCILKKGGS